MKTFVLIGLIVFSSAALAFNRKGLASPPKKDAFPGEITRPLPTESTDVIPGETPPEASPFQKTVEEAPNVVVGQGEAIVYEKEAHKKSRTEQFRADSHHTIMVGYQLLTTWLPGKKTVSYTYIFNQDWSLEGEYSWQTINADFIGVDLGEISERRYSLLGRRYFGNSFHMIMGAMYQDFRATASAKIINQGVDASRFGAQGIGAVIGLGNRWQLKNGITLGIDWMRVNVPLLTTKTDDKILKGINNDSDSDDVKKVIRTFNRFPTFVVFGLSVGYTF